MPLGPTRSAAAFLLLAALFTTALLSPGCAPTRPPEAAWEQDARALLEQAEGLFAAKQFEQAARTADAFLARYPKSRSADRALFLMGEIRLTARNHRQALSYYKELIEKFPASSLIVEAKYKLGLCYFELKEYDLAIANLEDRSRITDTGRLTRIAEMLSAAYLAKKNYPKATTELAYLAETATPDRQKAGYRDRVRELIDKNFTEDELKTLSTGTAYPADVSLLRLASLLIEERKYRDAVAAGKTFLERYPAHPEKTRAELLVNEATTKLTAPRYYIAALVPQSGQLAFFGDRVLKGVQLAVNTYNAQNPDERVDIVVKDTEGSPEKAAAALTELASKGVLAAIGPITSREIDALAPMLEKLHIPAIRPAASRTGLPDKSAWVFMNALTIDSQAKAAAEYALGLQRKKFVILYPDEPYGRDLARLFARDLEKKAEVLADVPYQPEMKDFGAYIKRVIEIDLRSRKVVIPDDETERKKLFSDYTPSFDAVYLPGYADRVGLLIPQLAFYNVTGVLLIGSDNWHSPDLIERAGRHAEGAVFVDGFFPESVDPAVKAVVDAYRSAFQEEPDILAAQAYDAAMMVFSLIKDRKDTPQAVRDGLLALKDYPGISGTTTFQGNGEAQKKLFLIKVEDGKFVLVKSEK